MKRYFKMHFKCYDELSYEAVLLYEIILNNYKVLKDFKKFDGETYVRFANHIINKYVGWSKYKIRSLFVELENEGYVNVQLTKKKIDTVRYIRLNWFPSRKAGGYFCFYDYLKELGIDAGLLLSYLIYDYNLYDCSNLNWDLLDENLTSEWSQQQKSRSLLTLRNNGYIKNENGHCIFDERFYKECNELRSAFDDMTADCQYSEYKDEFDNYESALDKKQARKKYEPKGFNSFEDDTVSKPVRKKKDNYNDQNQSYEQYNKNLVLPEWSLD